MLTGAGPGFCAGADLAEFKDLGTGPPAEHRAELTMKLHLAFPRLSKPVVTAINGAAMGGGAGLAHRRRPRGDGSTARSSAIPK